MISCNHTALSTGLWSCGSAVDQLLGEDIMSHGLMLRSVMNTLSPPLLLLVNQCFLDEEIRKAPR